MSLPHTISRSNSVGSQNHHDVPQPAETAQAPIVTIDGDPFYKIENVDRMEPFFISLASDSNHWCFLSSNGALTAGRTDSGQALFPYYTVDKIEDLQGINGPWTRIIYKTKNGQEIWEPFSTPFPGARRLKRNLYKSVWGNRIAFEEMNLELNLKFTYIWSVSEKYGFVRESSLSNLSGHELTVSVMDGVRNLMPPDISLRLQNDMSCLTDAYKLNELLAEQLAVYGMSSGIVDQAIAMESLTATAVWSLGLPGATVLISDAQLRSYLRGLSVEQQDVVRGRRGAYILCADLILGANETQSWQIVADVKQTQSQVVHLQKSLQDKDSLLASLRQDVRRGTERLQSLTASADGLQLTEQQTTCIHHYANVLFNNMRGGVFAHPSLIETADFVKFINQRNRAVAEKYHTLLADFPASLPHGELLSLVRKTGSADLERLTLEYVPITFGRRHGDPSRPWNKFAINIKDANGNPILDYQGNWRDIFQNWESLLQSYPAYTNHIIAKFVNATTAEGYNAYRISRAGIDWEVPDPEDPWAGIGYWGDHQLIYLLKLLEFSYMIDPQDLLDALDHEIYSYANVPYLIKPYRNLIKDPHNTILFDKDRHKTVLQREQAEGSDARLLQENGQVRHVNLTEKLLVTLMGKITNLVPGGGIWMNTQRPEWNDANNALVGNGVSVVTLCYLRRFLVFACELFAGVKQQEFAISTETVRFFDKLQRAVTEAAANSEQVVVDEKLRRGFVDQAGEAASSFRAQLYTKGLGGRSTVSVSVIQDFLNRTLTLVDASIRANRRSDGLYHAYNLLTFGEQDLKINYLYEMLEGQVAVLSSGLLSAGESAALLKAMQDSALFRKDQHSYMLYPDRKVPGFLEKNRVPGRHSSNGSKAEPNPRILVSDESGQFRFAPDLVNADALRERLTQIGVNGTEAKGLLELYERTFNHHAFTGRSGTMFAYEGLGSIYWHMVSKLLLATQESFYQAAGQGAAKPLLRELQRHYYQVRDGLGFNKHPYVYGAFPTDPYSHTPAQRGAQQPGMTGQVKEEILTRLGEFGLRLQGGKIHFQPLLLRDEEFLTKPAEFSYFASNGRREKLSLEASSLAFTYCQVPVLYHKGRQAKGLVWTDTKGNSHALDGLVLDAEVSRHIFHRSEQVRKLEVYL